MAKRAKGTAGGQGTRAILALTAAGLPHAVHPYEVAREAPESTVGEAAAAALGVSPERVFKTLIAEVDGRPVCAIVPTSGTLSLKVLAAAAGGKRAVMADKPKAERLTGYVTGGISPLGQTQRLATFLDASAKSHATLFVSAGQRGLQLELAPADLLACSGAELVPSLGTR